MNTQDIPLEILDLQIIGRIEKSLEVVKIFYEKMIKEGHQLRVGFSSGTELFCIEKFKAVVRKCLIQSHNSQAVRVVLKNCFGTLDILSKEYNESIKNLKFNELSLISDLSLFSEHSIISDLSLKYVVGYLEDRHFTMFDEEYFESPITAKNFENLMSFGAVELNDYCQTLITFLTEELFDDNNALFPKNVIEQLEKRYFDKKEFKLNVKIIDAKGFIRLLKKMKKLELIEYDPDNWANFIKRNILFNGKPSTNKTLNKEVSRIFTSDEISPKEKRITMTME